jgi:GAF domain-containing protein
MMEREPGGTKTTRRDWQLELRSDRLELAQRVLPIAIGAGVVFCLMYIGIYLRFNQPWQWAWMTFLAVLTTISYAVAYVLVRRGRLTVAVYLMTMGINLHVVAGPALVEGLVVPGILVGLLGIMFARLMAGRMENRVVVITSGLALLVGPLLSSYPMVELAPTPSWLRSAITAVTTVGVVSMAALILELRDERYERSLSRAEEYGKQLAAQQAALEERTQELELRTRYLEATTEVTQEIGSMLELKELLARVMASISQRFDFHRAGIFLLNPTRDWAVLEAASGEAARQALARGLRLRVDQENAIGHVIRTGKVYVTHDGSKETVPLGSSEGTETRCEVTLPLQARGEIIGALDVQSADPDAFSKEVVTVLRTLANQVAMAISNARLFRQAQESLEGQRRAYGELSRQAWAEMARTPSDLGYRYDRGRVTPLGSGSQLQSWHDSERGQELPELTLPVRVRGHVIGTITSHKPNKADDWTSEEAALMEALADQLGIALESARLHADAQRRAARERLIGEVAAQVRASLNVDAILKSTIREVGRALGAERVSVELTGPAKNDGDRPGQEPALAEEE